MSIGIFSTYITAENRVTSTIMAVVQSLSLMHIERLIGNLIGESNFTLVNFKSQPSKGALGVPDYELSSNCKILVETKIIPGTINKAQLERHLKRFDSEEFSNKNEYLLVLTPDKEIPTLGMDSRIRWASFSDLNTAIEEILTEKTEAISEREAFLLHELQNFLLKENLLQPLKNVVVVAARTAWPLYQQHSVYICQQGRTFAPVKYMAFYSEKEIKPVVAEIKSIYDNVFFDGNREKDDLSTVINNILDSGYLESGSVAKLIVLSDKDNSDTIKLSNPISNDLPYAFTMGQRYVELDVLRKSNKTSEISEK